MKKRVMKTLLAGALLISTILCGADKDVTPEKGAVLKVWESEGVNGDYIKFVGKKFKEKYGVEVIHEEVRHTDAPTRMETDGPAGNGADVFALPHDRLGSAINAGLLMENLVSSDIIKKSFMLPAVTAATAANGKIYAWPISIETYGLFYNKKMFPKPPATFEEILSVGKKLTNPKENKYGLIMEAANFYFIHAFLAMNGGYVFGKNGTNSADIGLNSKAAIVGIEQMIRIKEISLQNTGDINYDVMMGLFGEGKVASIISGPWSITGLKKASVEYGIAPLPTFGGKHPKSFSGLRLLGVSTYTKYPKAAQLFCKMASSEEMLLERYKITRELPPVKSLVSNPEITGNPEVKPFLEQAQYAVPMPAIPEMAYVWEPAGAAVADIWNGKVKTKAAMDNAVKTIKESIMANKK